MKAIQLNHIVESPDDLSISILPNLKPSPDRYIVRVHAAATNFFDILQIQGKHQQKPNLPWIAGNEFAGEIIALPTATNRPWVFQIGDRVFGAGLGAFATEIAVDQESLRPMPESWSYVDASGLFYTAPTAYAALTLRAKANAGDYVLIHGGAGALGLAAIQISKALGMTVIATVNGQTKSEVARYFGADFVLDSEGQWEDEARSRTPHSRGVDVVLDPLGMIGRSLKCIRWNGRLVVIGFAAGKIERIPTNQYLLKNVSVSGLFWGMYQQKDPDAVLQVWNALLQLISQGKIRPMVYERTVFKDLEEVGPALKLLSSGEAWGKIVIEIVPDRESKL